MATQERLNITDPVVMRALAHPARMAIMEHLSVVGTDVTATECAAVVGLTPSATSYHLRELAKVEMLEEAPSRGDGRERVWRAKAQGFAISTKQGSGPEGQEAGRTLVEAFLARQDQRVRGWLAVAQEEPEEWYDTVTVNEIMLLLTAPELRQLLEAIEALVHPYKRVVRENPPGGSRRVSLQLRAVPVD